MQLTTPTSGPGSQMGTKSRAILECLRKNGKLNRLDLEMKLSIGPLKMTINRLYGLGYIKNPVGISGMYEVTKAGRTALGEDLAIKTTGAERICNGTMKSIYNPLVDGVSRVGLARV
jgi:hypothetical protein